ncbi:MAG: flagellar export chaperone FliS [Aquificaceae bacterium]|nr:flagellar export chaperone FliS [Aquificaceae bacterium]
MKYENLEKAILGATPIRHVRMLYEGAIDSLERALEIMKNHSEDTEDLQRKLENLEKAMDIIAALELTLNERDGGDIAKQLHQIYVAIGNDLGDIIIKNRNDVVTVEKAIKVLKELKEAWEEVEREVVKGG